ncbi:MAG: hypothetical protein WAO71_01065 [Gallionella sp.]
MIVIADNDIIHKLALCNLLDELLVWLDVPPNEIWVLPELKFRVRKKLKSHADALTAFNRFLQKTAEIPAALPATLQQFSTLDVGEQQLFAVFVEQIQPPRLVTGDKRALKQITTLSQNDTSLREKLAGRVDCLESIMLGLIEQVGFDAINPKIDAMADKVLAMAFGVGRTQAHTVEALQSFLGNLRQDAPFVILRDGSISSRHE